MGGGGSDLFSKVYIGQRGEGVKYWQNFADVLYGWPHNEKTVTSVDVLGITTSTNDLYINDPVL